ncbi:MAG: nucleotidyltransferase family protein [Bacteroidetes bacterium]|nr:nucleotidyltransferase family protein [Bacteroidota bacterium]
MTPSSITIRLKQDWAKTILPLSSTLEQAVRNLNDTKLQIVLVCDENTRIIGTITDGDIRRGLLRGLNLNSPIQSVINYKAFVATPTISEEMAINLMLANRIQQLPVVDENRCVVGLLLWDQFHELPVKRPNTMVIMAGGIGVRLRPHTENCPKPMLPIAGKPMLEHIIERAKSYGFNHFVFAVYYLGNIIEDYFGNGDPWQVRIEYLHEKTPLGTAGALSLLNPRPTLPFIVSNGDVMTNIRYNDILDFHNRFESSATMAVSLHEWQQPFGVVETNGVDIIGFQEKPVIMSRINAGVYVLNPESLDQLKTGENCDMPSLFEMLRKKGKRTIAYPIYERWRDVGKFEDLSEAIAD